MKPILLSLTLFLNLAAPAAAQPYHLDTFSFGVNGYSIPVYPANDIGYDLVLQPADGKIIAVGVHNSNCIVARFLPDGSPDASFGFGGSTTFKFGTLNSVLNSVALQPDGKIVVAGGSTSGFPPLTGLVRLLPNGQLDATFGMGGKVVLQLAQSWAKPASDLALQPDGKILLLTSTIPDTLIFNDYATTVLRFKPNGSLDSTFFANGKTILNMQQGSDETANALALQPDGKIIVTSAITGNGNDGWAMCRLLPNGSIDPGFGAPSPSGITKYYGLQLQQIALQPDGKILAAGSDAGSILVARFTANGAYDPTFASGGTYISTGLHCRANGLALQPDGKVVLTGFARTGNLIVGYRYYFLVSRLNANGSEDNTFSAAGSRMWWTVTGEDEELHKVALQPNGKIVCVGYYLNAQQQQDLVLLRLTNNNAGEPPTASFTAINTTGCAPLTVQFTSIASGNTTGWLWNFPGGSPATSTAQNPTVTYATAGMYSVILTATNAAGSNTATQSSFVTVNPLPTAGFMAVQNGAIVTFSNTSTNNVSYNWDFGDSQTSQDSNPSHMYAAAGTYTVVLTVMGLCGTAVATQEVVIGPGLVADFSASNTVGCVPLTVQFTDQSQSATSWQWTFPGGNPATSIAQNPTVTYSTSGKYDVMLEVSHPAFGTKTKMVDSLVVVRPLPNATFSIEDLGGGIYKCHNSSTSADSYMWGFPGGTPATSIEANPTVIYATQGIYTVTLSALNNCGASILQKMLTTTSGTDDPAWAAGLRLFPNPTSGVFRVEMPDAPGGAVEFALFDLTGRLLRRESGVLGGGPLVRDFDLSDLPSGLYAMRIWASGQTVVRRVAMVR